MSINNAKDDFEKYRLTVQVRDESTLQLIPDATTGIDTWRTWRRKRHLGQGAFGEVWQEGTEDQYGDWHYRAVKVCSERKMQAAQIDYKRELSALAAFSKSAYSSWFVHLQGWWMQSGNIFVAMEYLPYGALSKYTTSALLEISIKEIAEDTLQGLKVMHKEGFTHRDIKPENILVVQKRPESPRWWVKIADFGISKRILEESESALHTTVGTRSYCAPEILGHIKQFEETSVYSNKVDMWSLGCVLFNVSSQGQIPFSESDLVRYCDGLIPFNPRKTPIRLSVNGQSFVKTLLKVEPEQRPTATEALRHPWFTMTGVVASNNTPALPAESYQIEQQNFNSFLNSTLSISPSLDTDKTGSTMSSVTTPPVEVVSEVRNASQGISINTRVSSEDTSTVTNHEAQPLPIALIPTETIHGSDEVSSLPTTAVLEAGPDTVISARTESVASKTVPGLRASYKTGQETLQSESHGTTKESEVPQQDTKDHTAPQIMTSDEHLKPIVWLREQGVNIRGKDDGIIALRLAVQRGQLKVIKWLQEQGFSVHGVKKDEHGRTTMHVAAENGHLEVVKYLREHGANINEPDSMGDTPFHLAASRGELKVVEYLREHGADLNKQNNLGRTALHVAASQGHLEIVKWLREEGGNLLLSKDKVGMTIMHLVGWEGYLETIKWLQEQGADLFEKDHAGRIALHHAVWGGHLEVTKWLLGQGVSINSKDDCGDTALWYAAEAGHLGMVKWLWEHGLGKHENINSAINCAKEEGHLGVIQYLQAQQDRVKPHRAKDQEEQMRKRRELESKARQETQEKRRELQERGRVLKGLEPKVPQRREPQEQERDLQPRAHRPWQERERKPKREQEQTTRKSGLRYLFQQLTK